jgi:hypothetical protein
MVVYRDPVVQVLISLSPEANTPWKIAKHSVKSSLFSILLSDVPSGNQIQGGYTMLYKWATSASFAKAISTVSSMLYPPENVQHTIHLNQTLIIHIFLSNYKSGHQIISAQVEITAKSSARGTLQKCPMSLISMRWGNKFSPPRKFLSLTVPC